MQSKYRKVVLIESKDSIVFGMMKGGYIGEYVGKDTHQFITALQETR